MKFTNAARFSATIYLLVCALFSINSYAQSGSSVSYKCAGNEYTDKPQTSRNGDCKLLEGGNVTYVHPPQTSTPIAVNATLKVANAPQQLNSRSSYSNNSAEQKARDSDSRGILESELKKAETKQVELLKEYNNGEPERNALDIKNPQRYVDRLAELKANIARNDSDIAGIKRELGRNQGSTARTN
jgi:hypothetical protein